MRTLPCSSISPPLRRYTLFPPEEKQWEVISAYLQEAGFAYCQDVAELLHVGKRKTAGILRRMVRDGQLLQFEKRYYLAKQPGQKQIQ